MEFRDVLKKNNGANFYLSDLHIHTPADKSKNYNMKGEQKKMSDANWCRNYVQKIIDAAYLKKLEIIAITDHNSVEWIDYFYEELRNIEPPGGQKKIIMFPGFEVNTNSGSGVHIICLFEPNTSKTKLDEYLSALFEAGERFDSNGYPKLAKKNCIETIEFCQNNGGICIGAHSLNDNGILSGYGSQPRVENFINPQLLAIEIPGSKNKLTGFNKNVIEGRDANYKRERKLAVINSSDADSLEKIGEKTTYIKMSSISIEGLREGFLDWQSRIRLKEEHQKNNFSKILCIYWDGADCFLKYQLFHFNDNLNTIIGGKGTGKSTIIETLRYVFDQVPKSPQAKKSFNEIIKDVFKSGSTAKVLVYSSQYDRHYLIERSYPGQPVIKIIDEEKLKQEKKILEKEILDISIDSISIPEIYGQKEIYDISDNPAFQFELIDRFLNKNFKKYIKEEKDISEQLRVNKKDIIKVSDILNKIDENRKELNSINEMKKKYKDCGVDERLRKQRNYVKEKNIFIRSKEKIQELSENFEDFFGSLDTNISYISDDLIKTLPNVNLLKDLKKILENTLSSIESKQVEIHKVIKSARFKIEGIQTDWEPNYQKQLKDYQNTINDLKKDNIPLDPVEFMKLETRENLIKSIVEDFKKYQKEQFELIGNRNKLLKKLNEIRLKQFEERKKVEDLINKKLEGVIRIKIKYAANRTDFINHILSYSSRYNRIMKEPIKKMVYDEKFNTRLFVDSFRKGEQSLIQDLGLTPGTAASLYRAIPLEDYYDLETKSFKSKTSIKLYIGPPDIENAKKKSEDFRETNHLSKGQKCTAILTLILLKSENPLVIDQPEDDLDNRFVVDDVVKRLRSEKENRQFIIATHNANITISADSELIIALDADNKKGREIAFGSIDDRKIKEAVGRIIEGGKAVFLLRKEKYGF